MKKPVKCTFCGGGHYVTFCQRKPNKAIKIKKRPKQVGRKGLAYNAWRDEVAIPYLATKNGLQCAICGSGGPLDVAHLKGRGSHAQLKMELSNVRLLCRPCHLLEHKVA